MCSIRAVSDTGAFIYSSHRLKYNGKLKEKDTKYRQQPLAVSAAT